jgi:hypothetical protein
MPRCKKGTRKNKKTGECEPYDKNAQKRNTCKKGTRRNKQTGECEELYISEADLNEIIHSFDISEDKRRELEELKPYLRKIKYNRRYKSCFTNKPAVHIYELIQSKIACHLKYDDDI